MIFLIALIFLLILDIKLCHHFFLYYYTPEVFCKFVYAYEKYISMHFVGRKVSTQ